MLNPAWSYRDKEALHADWAIEDMGCYWYEDPLADQAIYN